MTALPIDSLRTPRFCGVPSFMRLPLATSLAGLDAAIIGLPSDSGGPYRTGARFAPNAIRGISAMLRPINPYRGGAVTLGGARLGNVLSSEDTAKYWAALAGETGAPETLQLKGIILSGARPHAVINGEDFEVQTERDVPLADKKVRIRCLYIGNDSVMITNLDIGKVQLLTFPRATTR